MHVASHRSKIAIFVPLLYLSIAAVMTTGVGLIFRQHPTANNGVSLLISMALLLGVLAAIRIVHVNGDRLHVRGLFTNKAVAHSMAIFVVRRDRGARSFGYTVRVMEGSREIWFGDALSESLAHGSARRLNRIFRSEC